MDILIAIFTDYGYFAVFFILLICGFGVPIPEDITLVAGGIIAGLGFADVHTMFAVGAVGVLIGDGTMFTWAGYSVSGSRNIDRSAASCPHRFAHVQDKFAKYGNCAVCRPLPARFAFTDFCHRRYESPDQLIGAS